MQFEFDYWYEAWERHWQESLAYAFKRMKQKIEYEARRDKMFTYEDWLADWEESLVYAFKRMKESFDYECWLVDWNESRVSL